MLPFLAKTIWVFIYKFDVHGSVHLGNVYVQLKVQLDVHVFICIIYSCKKNITSQRLILFNLCLPQIKHTYGCILQFVLLRMGVISTRNM
jgi:hypothetical protein